MSGTAWTHYQAFESIGEDNEVELGKPVTTQAEAVRIAQESGVPYFFVYRCRQVTPDSGKPWWMHASSYSYCSF